MSTRCTSDSRRLWKQDGQPAPLSGAGALGEGPPAVVASDGADDEEPEAAALRSYRAECRRSIEPAENPLQFRGRDPDAAIDDADGDPILSHLFELDLHMD